MAKSTTTKAPKPAKAPKPPKTPAGSGSVGPIDGTLEGKPDVPAADPAPKAPGKPNYDVEKLIKDQFAAIENTLAKTCLEGKQPRQLRFALTALEAAKDQALRHIKHNV